jgi:hypothetical protein
MPNRTRLRRSLAFGPLQHVLDSHIGNRKCIRKKRNPESLSELNDSEQRLNGKEHRMKYPTSYRTAQIDGLSIFYREAGPRDAPTLLLLHGLPSSSRMFEPLFARLSDRYRMVAPDYPGFGHSDWPDPQRRASSIPRLPQLAVTYLAAQVASMGRAQISRSPRTAPRTGSSGRSITQHSALALRCCTPLTLQTWRMNSTIVHKRAQGTGRLWR